MTVGLFVTSGSVPAGADLSLRQDTPGADAHLYSLGRDRMSIAITAPGTYRVLRPDITRHGVDVGVYLES